jgi:hypothetical protein
MKKCGSLHDAGEFRATFAWYEQDGHEYLHHYFLNSSVMTPSFLA